MIFEAFSILDTASGAFGIPFFSVNEQVASRNFRMLVNDPQAGSIYNHPADYRLYRIGSFDDATATLHRLDVVELIVLGQSVKVQLPPTPLEELINGKTQENVPSAVEEDLPRDGRQDASQKRPGKSDARRHPAVGH